MTSKEQAAQYHGAGSVLANMVAKLMEASPSAEIWTMGITELVGGVLATGKIAFTGTPTKAGVASFMIAGVNYQVGVATTDTGSTLAAALVALINANADSIVSATVDGTNAYEVNLAAKNKGPQGNEIDVRHSYFTGEELPAGLTVTITAMASGAGSPDLTSAIAALGEDQYLLFVSPFTDSANLVRMEAELTSRFGALRQNDGYAIYGKRETVGNLVTFGNARNSQFTTVMATKGPSSPWEKAAALAAQVSISIMADDAVRPFHTLPLVGIWAEK